jgi:hypothetical protein
MVKSVIYLLFSYLRKRIRATLTLFYLLFFTLLICKIYTLICKFYTLIFKIYTLICKIHTLICKFYTLICKIYTLICKIHTLICKSWIGPGPAGHNFERGPPKDHCDQVWF